MEEDTRHDLNKLSVETQQTTANNSKQLNINKLQRMQRKYLNENISHGLFLPTYPAIAIHV